MAETHPIRTHIATIQAGAAVAQSASLSQVVSFPTAVEVRIPVAIQFSNVSADPIVKVYPSSDGGNSFDTDAMVSIPLGRISTGLGQRSLRLDGGIYALQILNSGPNTATVFVFTPEILTAYESN